MIAASKTDFSECNHLHEALFVLDSVFNQWIHAVQSINPENPLPPINVGDYSVFSNLAHQSGSTSELLLCGPLADPLVQDFIRMLRVNKDGSFEKERHR